MKQFSFSFWNIGGLNSSIFGNKLNTTDFLHNCIYDINIIAETWGRNPAFDTVPNYTPIINECNKRNETSTGRASGYGVHLPPKLVLSILSLISWFYAII